MDFGKVIRGVTAGKGRVLLRTKAGRADVIFTTGISDGQISVNLSSEERLDRCRHTRTLSDPMWDVTSLTVIRPDMTTHGFSDQEPKNGELFIHSNGRLVMAGIRVGSYQESDPVYFHPDDGEEVTDFNYFESMRFASWRLVVKDAPHDAAPLFKWPATVELAPRMTQL